MNISGNFQTATREVAIVKRILDENSISYISVKKYQNADDADVAVEFADGREILIEVKEEDYKRFIKYCGDLGIDYISVFQFKSGVKPENWKKLHSPNELAQFKQDIDRQKRYKGGKVFYSKADLWLFFVVKPDGDFYYCKFFNGADMTSPAFIKYIESNCKFTANAKSESQMSHDDSYNSACMFLNNKDKTLQMYEVADRRQTRYWREVQDRVWNLWEITDRE